MYLHICPDSILRNTLISSKGLMSCLVIGLCCESIRVDVHNISPETLDLPCRPKDPAPLDSILALTLYPGSSPAKHKSLPAQRDHSQNPKQASALYVNVVQIWLRIGQFMTASSESTVHPVHRCKERHVNDCECM